jgi:hypothetical protein
MHNKRIEFALSAPDSQRRSAFARGTAAALGGSFEGSNL